MSEAKREFSQRAQRCQSKIEISFGLLYSRRRVSSTRLGPSCSAFRPMLAVTKTRRIALRGLGPLASRVWTSTLAGISRKFERSSTSAAGQRSRARLPAETSGRVERTCTAVVNRAPYSNP
ncbi:hypothetical protein KM043_001838 [Ampulex compressa]|nr:hypothetical protein KM043_001838 [Ampulex compressa]